MPRWRAMFCFASVCSATTERSSCSSTWGSQVQDWEELDEDASAVTQLRVRVRPASSLSAKDGVRSSHELLEATTYPPPRSQAESVTVASDLLGLPTTLGSGRQALAPPLVPSNAQTLGSGRQALAPSLAPSNAPVALTASFAGTGTASSSPSSPQTLLSTGDELLRELEESTRTLEVQASGGSASGLGTAQADLQPFMLGDPQGVRPGLQPVTMASRTLSAQSIASGSTTLEPRDPLSEVQSVPAAPWSISPSQEKLAAIPARQEAAGLEDMQRQRAHLEYESDELRRRNVLLQRALAHARGSKTPPEASEAEHQPHELHDLLVALLAAACVALLQGAFGAMMYLAGDSVSRCCCGREKKKKFHKLHCRCIVWSPRSLGFLWLIFVLLDFGFAVMWHFGIVQPFLKQMVVVMYLIAGLSLIVSLIIHEMWLHMRAKVDEAQEVVDFIHDKTDDVLHILGLHNKHHESDKENADVEQDADLGTAGVVEENWTPRWLNMGTDDTPSTAASEQDEPEEARRPRLVPALGKRGRILKATGGILRGLGWH